jgi:transcriptional regulator with XRE-family HTH domain
MNLHNVRKDLTDTLRATGLSQYEFAVKHGLSYSWVNKFLNEVADNPRLNSLTALEEAIEIERKGQSAK